MGHGIDKRYSAGGKKAGAGGNGVAMNSQIAGKKGQGGDAYFTCRERAGPAVRKLVRPEEYARNNPHDLSYQLPQGQSIDSCFEGRKGRNI